MSREKFGFVQYSEIILKAIRFTTGIINLVMSVISDFTVRKKGFVFQLRHELAKKHDTCSWQREWLWQSTDMNRIEPEL
jgi:hypothetical protein